MKYTKYYVTLYDFVAICIVLCFTAIFIYLHLTTSFLIGGWLYISVVIIIIYYNICGEVIYINVAKTYILLTQLHDM